MHVHRAVHVRSPAQDGAVQRKARTVDAGALVQVLVHVNLDEIRGGYLRPQYLVLLHQEFSVFPRNAHGAVVVNDIIPAMVRDQTIDGGEVDAALPFRRGDRGRWAGLGMDVHGKAPHGDGRADAWRRLPSQYSNETGPRIPAELVVRILAQ